MHRPREPLHRTTNYLLRRRRGCATSTPWPSWNRPQRRRSAGGDAGTQRELDASPNFQPWKQRCELGMGHQTRFNRNDSVTPLLTKPDALLKADDADRSAVASRRNRSTSTNQPIDHVNIKPTNATK